MTADTIVALDRAGVRAALTSMGLRYNANSVRPPKRGDLVDRQTGLIVADGPLRGAQLTVELWKGRASDGYKSDYESRPRWWVLLYVSAAGESFRLWAVGNRFTSEAKARLEYGQSAADIRTETR